MGTIPADSRVRRSLQCPARRLLTEAVPVQVRLKTSLDNPALPPRLHGSKPTNRSSSQYVTDTNGIGPRRVYLRIESEPPNVAYPPRPVPGSVADLDMIMEHCDFSDHKVRYLPSIRSLISGGVS